MKIWFETKTAPSSSEDFFSNLPVYQQFWEEKTVFTQLQFIVLDLSWSKKPHLQVGFTIDLTCDGSGLLSHICKIKCCWARMPARSSARVQPLLQMGGNREELKMGWRGRRHPWRRRPAAWAALPGAGDGKEKAFLWWWEPHKFCCNKSWGATIWGAATNASIHWHLYFCAKFWRRGNRNDLRASCKVQLWFIGGVIIYLPSLYIFKKLYMTSPWSLCCS